MIRRFSMNGRVTAIYAGRTFTLTRDEEALIEEALLDGHSVIKSNVPEGIADKDTLHAR